MSDVSISITTDSSSAVRDLQRLRNGFSRLRNSASSFASGFARAVSGKIKTAFKTLNTMAKTARRFIASIGSAFKLLNLAALAMLMKHIHQVTTRFIVHENALKSVIGTTKGAGEAMDYLSDQSQRLGADVLVLSKSYLKFMAAGKESRASSDELHDMFEALAETGTILQMSNQELEGAFRALTQMMSKGKVQAEELRGQLGEHLPGAFEIAAHSMGLTTRELDEMLKKGQITAEMLVKKLPQGLRDAYGASLPGAVKTARAEFVRLHNDINLFLKDNKTEIDAVFKRIAVSVRKLWANLKQSGLFEWLMEADSGFAGMLDFVAEAPRHLELIYVKAKAFYETSVLNLKQFLATLKGVFATIDEKSKLKKPKIKDDPSERTYTRFLEAQAKGTVSLQTTYQTWVKSELANNTKEMLNWYETKIAEIKNRLKQSEEEINSKYKDKPFVGPPAPRVKFDSNSNSPVAPEALLKGTQKSVDSFHTNLAKMRGPYAEELESFKQSKAEFNSLLENSRAMELISTKDWNDAKELLRKEHEEKLFKIGKDYSEKEKEANEARITEEARGWSLSAKYAEQSMKFNKMTSYETTTAVLDNFQSMASGLANESKSAFEANKAFSIAIAVMKGYESAISSYAAGARIGGPVLGASFAAVSVAFTARQIKAISEQSFGGGSSSPSSPPPTVQTPETDETNEPNDSAGGQSGITIIIQGSIIGDDKVKDVMIDAIERAQFNDEIRIIGNGG